MKLIAPAIHLFCIAAIMMIAAPAQSTAIEGADDPQLKTAVGHWLADEDARSLPALARLANGGNRAARLLLGRIEATERGASDFVWSLSHQDRMAIFRPAGARSSFTPGWLRAQAQTGDELAAALDASLSLGINLSLLRKLKGFGEEQATEHLVRKIGVDGTKRERLEALELIGQDGENAPFIKGFLEDTLKSTTGRFALARMTGKVELPLDPETRWAAIYVDIGFQMGTQMVSFPATNRYYDRVAKWVMSAPEAQPLRTICDNRCEPAGKAACAVTAFGLVGGYYEVIRYDSPVESIIPQATFLGSPRATNMALRQMASATDEVGYPTMTDDQLKDRRACLQQALDGLTRH